jgi:hypothetical protein
MPLTIKEIWKQSSQVKWFRKMSVKRLQVDGTYESDFFDISHLQLKEGSVNRLSRSLPNSSFKFGKVLVGNANLSILSPHQEFSNENQPKSIFNGFVRHRSLIKIEDGYIDNISDPDNPAQVITTVFQGLIDGNTATTENGVETLTVLDLISVLDEVYVNIISLSETSLNALIYEAMNRSEFTDLFNVSNSTTYIDAGYNIQNIDITEYEGSVLDMFEELAKGHSIFYIDPTDNHFYFKEAAPKATVDHEFHEANNRKISISRYREGRDRVITRWFWEGTAINAAEFPVPFVQRVENLDIKGVTDPTDQRNTLEKVLEKTKDIKPYFQLEIPYYPVIDLLDRVTVEEFGYASRDAARWGYAKYGEDRFTNVSGIRISKEVNWMVRSVKHSSDLKTTLELEMIPN